MATTIFDPTTGAPIFLDSHAPDPAVNPSQVAAFAASVGTRLIGTTAERTAYDYAREGLAWWDTTLDALMVYDGSGWTTLVRSGSYTPSLNRATIGNGTVSGNYTRVGRMVTVQGRFVLGSTSSLDAASGALTVGVSLPTAADSFYGSSVIEMGDATMLDASGEIYYGKVTGDNGTTRANIYALSGSPIRKQTVNSTSPMTWASGDVLSWLFTYMAAS